MTFEVQNRAKTAICGTDLHILSVPPGHPATPGSILGHEYVATVEQAGSAVNGLETGDRVVIDPNLTCGLCQSCRSGQTNCCENMTTLGIFRNGGLAEFNVAPAKALHKINRDVPVEQAALAEPLTCVLHAFEKVPITVGVGNPQVRSRATSMATPGNRIAPANASKNDSTSRA